MRKLQFHVTKPHQVAILSGFDKNISSSSSTTSLSGSASFGVLMLAIMECSEEACGGFRAPPPWMMLLDAQALEV